MHFHTGEALHNFQTGLRGSMKGKDMGQCRCPSIAAHAEHPTLGLSKQADTVPTHWSL